MKLQLTGLAPWSSALHIEVETLPVVVGRGAAAGVRIPLDCWISRAHCGISECGGTLVVRDLGSKHGTFVNGVKISEAHLLPGDRLTVGMTNLRVDYQRAAREQSGTNLAGAALG